MSMLYALNVDSGASVCLKRGVIVCLNGIVVICLKSRFIDPSNAGLLHVR